MDGINVVEDTTSIPAIGYVASNDSWGIEASEGAGAVGVLFSATNTNVMLAYTEDNGVTWDFDDAGSVTPPFKKSLACPWDSNNIRDNKFYTTAPGTTTVSSKTSTGTSWSGSAGPTGSSNKSAMGFFFDESAMRIYGVGGGGIYGSSSGWTGDDTTTFNKSHNSFAYSPFHNRLVVVGDGAQIGYLDSNNKAVNNAWTLVANGGSQVADLNSVAWSGADGLFIAVGSTGQILLSSSGIN